MCCIDHCTRHQAEGHASQRLAPLPRWGVRRGFARGLLGVETFHRSWTPPLHCCLGAVDVGLVLVIRGAWRPFEGLLRQRCIVPMDAVFMEAWISIQGHRAAPVMRSASGTRSSPEMSLGSRVSRSWARERTLVRFLSFSDTANLPISEKFPVRIQKEQQQGLAGNYFC